MQTDIEQIITVKGGYANQYFSSYYANAILDLKENLKKGYLSGVKKFFNCTNINLALKMLQRKLVSYTKNQMLAYRSTKMLQNDIKKFEKSEQFNQIKNHENQLLTEIELAKMSRSTLIVGLHELFNSRTNNPNFESEFEYLLTKFNIKKEEILDEFEQILEEYSNNFSQMVKNGEITQKQTKVGVQLLMFAA